LRKQCAFLCARQQLRPEFKDDALAEICAGSLLSEHFLNLARELDVVEPKLPEDIFKSHLERKGALQNFDSARQNLASTFVNAFVNAGFGADKLMLTEGARSAAVTRAATRGRRLR
jgi:26S proteasome regulatory subunit N1